MTNFTTPTFHGYLQKVLDLLLDLANDADNCWLKIKAKQNEIVAKKRDRHMDRRIEDVSDNWLRQALTVRWGEEAESSLLLVTSSWHETSDETMTVATFTAIRRCLSLCKGVQMTNDQISDAFNLLEKLGLLKDEAHKKDLVKGYRNFRIDFSDVSTREKDACTTYVENRWKNLSGRKDPNRSQSSSNGNNPNAALLSKLDGLVSRLKAGAEERLKQVRKGEKKDIHVPLKAKICGPDHRERECVPTSADLRGILEAEGGQMLLIWGEGGAGKTSLAFEIALWGLQGELADHVVLPFFLEPSGSPENDLPLSQCVAKHLDSLSDISVSAEEVEPLLRHRRLLLIVDHYSEFTDAQRRWVENHLPTKSLVLLTSRVQDPRKTFQKNLTITEIHPLKLKEQELFHFFREYLNRRGGEEAADGQDSLLTPEDYTYTRDLLERMVGNQPITVLLAWMVIEKAIEHVKQQQESVKNGIVDLLPSTVPDLMEEYVKKCCTCMAIENRWLKQDPASEPQWILTILKALALEAHRQGDLYQPQNFTESVAALAWQNVPFSEKLKEVDQRRALLQYMMEKLTLLIPKASDQRGANYRFSLDPLSDYLAALAMQEIWEGNPDRVSHRQAVQAWLDGQVGRQERLLQKADAGDHDVFAKMRGLLAACRDCYRRWLNRFDASLDATERTEWEGLLDDFAFKAKIDKDGERIMSVKHLIRRHAKDLEWANPELRVTAIAKLTAFA